MRSAYFPKAPITDHIVATVRSIGYPVGDAGMAEEAHGWQGEPNSDGTNFIPWYVVMPGQAGRSSGGLGAAQSNWFVPYYFTIAGVGRKQTEMMSDLLRKAMIDQTRVTLTCYETQWTLMNVNVVSIGGITRQSAVNPSYYLQTDTIEMAYSKELT